MVKPMVAKTILSTSKHPSAWFEGIILWGEKYHCCIWHDPQRSAERILLSEAGPPFPGDA